MIKQLWTTHLHSEQPAKKRVSRNEVGFCVFNKHKILILILLCILFTQLFAFSQQSQWRRAVGTEGIAIYDIDIYEKNHDTLYAFGYRFLRSVDNGEHWDTLPGPAQFISGALRVDRLNSNIVYTTYSPFTPVQTGENLLAITRYGGYNWQTMFSSRDWPATVVEIDPADWKVVYIGVGSGMIKRTTDQGQTWQDLTPFQGVGLTSLAIAASNDSILYAGPYYGLYKSVDRGTTWTQLPFGYSAKYVVDPRDANVLYAAAPGGFYKSTDGGVTWVEKDSGFIPEDSYSIEDILINPKNLDELFVAKASIKNKFVFRSTDGGESWFDFSNGIPDSGGRATSIAIDTLHGRLYLSSVHGIYILDMLTSVHREASIIPADFRLFQNYPNPFNPVTQIRYALPRPGYVILKVYNILGQEVITLVNEMQEAGYKSVNLNANNLPSGIYIYRLNAGTYSSVKKMLLLK